MEALAQEVGETIFLGVLCEESVLVVEKVEHNQVLRISPELGTSLPLRQTALGQVWLAFCPAAQREALLAILVAPERVMPVERVLTGLRQELSAVVQQGVCRKSRDLDARPLLPGCASVEPAARTRRSPGYSYTAQPYATAATA
jgi:DNA-binding IclR family transcriptional regulator